MATPHRKSALASLMALLGFGCKGEPASSAAAEPAGQPAGERVSKPLSLDDVLKQDQPLLIDVRSPGEFAQGHVPGSINIPVNQIDDIAKAIPSKDAPVVLFCASGGRSGSAIRQLKRQGYTGLVNGGGFRGMAKKMGVQLAR